MGRPPKENLPLTAETPLNPDLDANRREHAGNMAAVLEQFGDGLPYDQERLIHETLFYMQQSAEAALQVGRRLVVLKEAIPHGEFISIVENRLGINHTTAKRLMQAAVKLSAIGKKSNGATSHHLLEHIASKSKLFELMTLDTDDLEALAEGGTVANLELDDVERMSVSELRAALREHKENYKAQGELVAQRDTRIADLQTDLRKAKRHVQETPLDEAVIELAHEVNRYAFAALASIRGDLNRGIAELLNYSNVEGKGSAAIAHGWLLEIERAVAGIRAELNIPASLDAEVLPEFARMMRDDTDGED